MFHEGLGCRKDFSIDKFEISSGCVGQKCQMSILNLKLCQTWCDRQIVKQGSRLLGWPSFIFHISSLIRWNMVKCVFRRGFSATPSVWPCSLCWRGCSATTPDASTQPKRSKEIQRAQETRGLPRAEGQHKARKARNIIKEASRRAWKRKGKQQHLLLYCCVLLKLDFILVRAFLVGADLTLMMPVF